MISTEEQKTAFTANLICHPQPAAELRRHDPPLSVVERIPGYAADIRAGEGSSVLLLTLNVFLLLFAYYLLKTVREALILTEGSAYIKAYSSAGQAALLMALVPLYGYVATKVSRIKLLGGLLCSSSSTSACSQCSVRMARGQVSSSISGSAFSMYSSSARCGHSLPTSIRKAKVSACFR